VRAHLGAELERLARDTPLSGWRVAFSGGLDSAVLLAALLELRREEPRWQAVPLRAMHVHHGLRAAADAWARHCRGVCRRLGVPLQVRRVRVLQARGASLEAAAREARYAALGRGLKSDEWLLTAHHADDQLETMLLQWMRGAGVAGLAAMPSRAPFGAGFLMRPLLAVPRAELERYARANELVWVEDDSNLEQGFERNYLRAQVVPLLQARWPAAARVATRSAAHLGEAKALLEEIAALDLAALLAPGGQALNLAALAALSAARQRNVLRHWLARRGLTVPDTVHLERIRLELPSARADAQPRVRWAGGEVRRFREHLFAFTAAQSAALTRPRPGAREPALQPWDWRRDRCFELDANRGRLQLVADAQGTIDGDLLPARLWVGGRVGGEKIRITPNGPRRALKALLRDAALPPWERERLPVIHVAPERAAAAATASEATIFAVGASFVDAAWQVRDTARGARSRYRLEWAGRFW